jgi:hypothetical protein
MVEQLSTLQKEASKIIDRTKFSKQEPATFVTMPVKEIS